jgi:DNA-binding NarL/FixJ family response regulator
MTSPPIVIGLVEPIRALRDIFIEHTVQFDTGCTISFAVSDAVELRDVEAHDVNILIVDISLKNTTFFAPAWLSYWMQVAPHASPLVITDCKTKRGMTAFLRSGARGYFIREHYSKFELFRGIAEVAAGRIALGSMSTQIMLGEDAPLPLLPREQQVLQALPLRKHMWNRKQIAELIGMSYRNLDNYVSDIGRKLAISPDHVVDFALANGLISAVDDPRCALFNPPGYQASSANPPTPSA